MAAIGIRSIQRTFLRACYIPSTTLYAYPVQPCVGYRRNSPKSPFPPWKAFVQKGIEERSIGERAYNFTEAGQYISQEHGLRDHFLCGRHNNALPCHRCPYLNPQNLWMLYYMAKGTLQIWLRLETLRQDSPTSMEAVARKRWDNGRMVREM